MSKVANITGREILNSRGIPTVSATVEVESGMAGTCAVPSGASSGSAEVKELRDGEERFGGQGVRSAVSNVKGPIHDELVGVAVINQSEIDERMIELDGTADKSRVGANAMLAVSIATAKAAAKELDLTLADYIASNLDHNMTQRPSHPRILANVINGGVHANSSVSIQEFLVISQDSNPKTSIADLFDIQQRLEQLIQNRLNKAGLGVGDEGGFVVADTQPKTLLNLLMKAIRDLDFALGMDVAASEFHADAMYEFGTKNLSTEELANTLGSYTNEYPLEYLEDPFAEDDFSTHAKFREASSTSVIGDDLTTTNPKRIQTAAESGSIDGVIIKPNQIGTLTETMAAVSEARKHGLDCYASHRSGETNDDFIVDVAVGFGCTGIKIGGLCRGERISKYNRLSYLYDRQ